MWLEQSAPSRCACVSSRRRDGRLFIGLGYLVFCVSDSLKCFHFDAGTDKWSNMFAALCVCVFVPPAAGNVTCRVQLTNAGNMRLADTSVLGDENDCVFALLWPSDVVSCNMTRWGGYVLLWVRKAACSCTAHVFFQLPTLLHLADLSTMRCYPQGPGADRV